MEPKKYSFWLKWIIIGMGLFGAVVYACVLPVSGREIAEQYPEFAYCYWPWLIFLWITAVPCYLVLLKAWLIAKSIGEGHPFTLENAKRLKTVSMLAAGDSAFLFVGNVWLLICNCNHPGILLMFMAVVFLGLAFSVTAAALSHLVYKAALLQEDNDLTI